MNLSQMLPLTMALLSMPLGAFGDEGNAGRTEFFEKRIRPVLVRHCYEMPFGGVHEAEGWPAGRQPRVHPRRRRFRAGGGPGKRG